MFVFNSVLHLNSPSWWSSYIPECTEPLQLVCREIHYGKVFVQKRATGCCWIMCNGECKHKRENGRVYAFEIRWNNVLAV